MSSADAYVVARNFAPEPERVFEMPFHYLLYAERGAMTLQADGRRWSLPPARAALIAAGRPVLIALPQHVRACSALFAPTFAPPPPATLAVFEVSQLARALLFSLRGTNEADPLGTHETTLFKALASEVWRLSEHPTRAVMRMPDSDPLRRALALTEARLADVLSIEDLASELATTPRSLARRFMAEIGMTWTEARRRLRMMRAIELLSEGQMPVTEVALSVGYSSISAFNAALRDFTGQTPSAFRNTSTNRA